MAVLLNMEKYRLSASLGWFLIWTRAYVPQSNLRLRMRECLKFGSAPTFKLKFQLLAFGVRSAYEQKVGAGTNQKRIHGWNNRSLTSFTPQIYGIIT
jgi:hypothetical protein